MMRNLQKGFRVEFRWAMQFVHGQVLCREFPGDDDPPGPGPTPPPPPPPNE